MRFFSLFIKIYRVKKLNIMFLIFIQILFVGMACQSESNIIEQNNVSQEKHVVYPDSSYFEVSKLMDLAPYVSQVQNGISHYYSQEGMAVYDDTAFILNECGFCRIINLQSKQVLTQINLASFSTYNHANNACFSQKFYDPEDPYPLLYVSPCNAPPTCYVERYQDSSNSFELIQTIHVATKSYNKYYTNFNLDNDNSLMYVFFVMNNSSCIIRSYKLPNIEAKDVTLTDSDMVSEYKYKFSDIHVWQGSYFYKGVLYVLYGGEQEKERGFYALNLASLTYKDLDFSSKFSKEPEAIAFYNHFLIINGNGDGIYFLYHLKE
jgi:hypothetical protein